MSEVLRRVRYAEGELVRRVSLDGGATQFAVGDMGIVTKTEAGCHPRYAYELVTVLVLRTGRGELLFGYRLEKVNAPQDHD